MIYGSPPGQCHLNGGRKPLSWRNLWEGLYFFCPEWGKVHNFMLICYMKYSTVNKMPQNVTILEKTF